MTQHQRTGNGGNYRSHVCNGDYLTGFKANIAIIPVRAGPNRHFAEVISPVSQRTVGRHGCIRLFPNRLGLYALAMTAFS